MRTAVGELLEESDLVEGSNLHSYMCDNGPKGIGYIIKCWNTMMHYKKLSEEYKRELDFLKELES